MPFIPIDLDAIDSLDDAALMAGISAGDMHRGTLRMWRHCFRSKTAYVSIDRLPSFYPGDPSKVAMALVACEFLDRPSNRPDFHVRGAEKRLGIREAQSEAGNKNKGNLRQFRKKPPASTGLSPESTQKTPALPGGEPEGEPGPPSESPTGSTPALTPNTQHPTPKEKEKNIVDLSEKSRAVFEYWKTRLKKTDRAKYDDKRKRAVDRQLEAGRTPEELMLAIDGCALSPWHQGENPDGKIFDDLELICRDAKHVEDFIATAQSPPRPRIQAASRGRASNEEKNWDTPPRMTADGNLVL